MLNFINQPGKYIIGIFCFLIVSVSSAQNKGTIVDQVAAVVSNHIVLRSDIEQQYNQMLQQGQKAGDDLRCRILDQLMLNKLLLSQAAIDSIQVSDDQVNQKIESNLSYYIQQIGSEEKLEQFYGKSIPEIKDEFRPLIKDQLLIQQMQSKLTKSVSASPSDVKEFYQNIPADSLPFINAEVEYAQIVKVVNITKEEKDAAKKTLQELKTRIEKGEDFSTLAILYSQDKESAKQGGELGFVNRADLVPEFAAAAFRLKNSSEMSDIIETQYGYHLIKLIERRGEKINVRHILITAKTVSDDVIASQKFIDSLATEIRNKKITFEDAALKYSDDTDTKQNGGVMMNPGSGSSLFDVSNVDPTILFQLDKMQPGEISSSQLFNNKDNKQALRILLLKRRTSPHKLNLDDDYQKLQEITLNDKQQKVIDTWRNKKLAGTYIRIADEYKSCSTLQDWIHK